MIPAAEQVVGTAGQIQTEPEAEPVRAVGTAAAAESAEEAAAGMNE